MLRATGPLISRTPTDTINRGGLAGSIRVMTGLGREYLIWIKTNGDQVRERF